MEYVVDVASAAGVHRTVLFHHDPVHDDDRINALVALANTRAAGRTQVVAAAEGDVVEASSASPRRAPHMTPAAWASPALEDLEVSVVSSAAIRRCEPRLQRLPALNSCGVVDWDAAASGDEGGGSCCRRHRRRCACARPPEVSYGPVRVDACGNRRGHPRPDATALAPAGVTDWLVWPSTVAHVRTKLRAAVLAAGESVDGRCDAS